MKRTKIFLVTAFSFWFIAFAVLISKNYERLSIGRNLWIAVTIVFSVLLGAIFIYDSFFVKEES